MSNESVTIVQKLWNFRNVLQNDVLHFVKICAKIRIYSGTYLTIAKERNMETLQKEHDLPLPPTDKVLFRKQVQHELDEIRQEAEEAYALDKEIDPIPDSAYNDTLVLLEMLCNYKLPMPEVSWAEDGSFSIGWYLDEGIITMGIYGTISSSTPHFLKKNVNLKASVHYQIHQCCRVFSIGYTS